MKRRPRMMMPHRRKREGRTDYRARLKLLKSRLPRLVVRRSIRNITCQVVRYEEKGDKVMVAAESRELSNFGWNFHGANLPAAYLTGLLCAERAKQHKIKEAVLDIGLYQTTPGNRLFSALKGAVDGGLAIPHSEDIFPEPGRLSGKHIAEYAEKLKAENPAKYKKIFSGYLKEKAEPKDMPVTFEETKKKIIERKGEKAKHAKHEEHHETPAHHHAAGHPAQHKEHAEHHASHAAHAKHEHHEKKD